MNKALSPFRDSQYPHGVCVQSHPFYAILTAMNAITFDTHKFITKLKSSGFEEKQAEALVSAFQEATGEADLVTKEYFDFRLKAEIESSKVEMIKWMAGLFLAQIAIFATLVKLIN